MLFLEAKVKFAVMGGAAALFIVGGTLFGIPLWESVFSGASFAAFIDMTTPSIALGRLPTRRQERNYAVIQLILGIAYFLVATLVASISAYLGIISGIQAQPGLFGHELFTVVMVSSLGLFVFGLTYLIRSTKPIKSAVITTL